jgi:hypothetical protein
MKLVLGQRINKIKWLILNEMSLASETKLHRQLLNGLLIEQLFIHICSTEQICFIFKRNHKQFGLL